MERKITLADVRKQMIERCESLVRKKQVKGEDGELLVPLYSDADYDKNISIHHYSEDVWAVMLRTVPALTLGKKALPGATIERLVVDADETLYYIDELYADDIETIMNRLESISEEEIKKNAAWYSENL